MQADPGLILLFVTLFMHNTQISKCEIQKCMA